MKDLRELKDKSDKEKMLGKHTSDNRLVSKLYKELTLTDEKTNHPVTEWTKILKIAHQRY